MRLAFLLFTFLLFVSTFSFGQKEDSVKIAEAFTRALSDPANKDAYLNDALKVKSSKNTAFIKDVYAYWNARYFFYSGEFDEAEKVVNAYLRKNPEVQKKAKFYNILGTVNTMRQDYKSAIASYEMAIDDFEENKDKKGAALVKINIANIFFSLSDFESAYKYSSQARKELRPFNDSLNLVNVLGILSISEARTNRLQSAKQHAQKTLELSKETDNKNGEALAYLALGEIALEKKNHNLALDYFSWTDSVSTLTRNVNLSHLARVGMLNAHIPLKNFKEAQRVGESLLVELGQVTNKTTEYVIRKKLAEANAGLGNFERAYILKREADSIYKVTSSIRNKEYINELLIRHDSERKENALKMERKENVIKEARLTQQGWILFALTLVLLIAILIFIGYRNAQRSRLKRLKTEQENELMRALIDGEERERERVANELHDGLASDLTGIKLILSQSENELPNGVLTALSRVHEQTRRISHNLSPLNIEQFGLVNALRNFAQENSNKNTQIHFFASVEDVKIEPTEHATLIYRISQELIQNALKHASCSNIDVQLIVQEKELTINIEDDGIGFDVDSKNDSFGLSNIRKQVKLLNGEFNIDSRPQNGTVVFISLPLK